MGTEIERKWTLNRVPKELKDTNDCLEIEQSYLSVNKYSETRLIKLMYPNGKVEFFVDIKSKSEGLSRIEVRTPISKEDYDDLLCPLIKDFLVPIFKRYKILPYDRGHSIEVSQVSAGNGINFVYAEVEFSSEEDAREFHFPWDGLVDKEVTNDPDYSLSNVWIRSNNLG